MSERSSWRIGDIEVWRVDSANFVLPPSAVDVVERDGRGYRLVPVSAGT